MSMPTKGGRRRTTSGAWPELPRVPVTLAQLSREVGTWDGQMQTAWNDLLTKLDRLTLEGRDITVNIGQGGVSNRALGNAGGVTATTGTSILTLLQAQLGDAFAEIRRLDEVVVTQDSALARSTVELTARIATNQARIRQSLSAYATRVFAEAKKSEAISASTAYTNAAITTEQTARADADSALTTSIETLDAQVNDPTTGLPNAHARVTTEASARASADSALTTSITTLDAQVNHPTTGLPNAHARVTSEASARASADTALSSSITTLTATVNDPSTGLAAAHTAVTIEASARASADGQIHARWGVNIDSNGRVTGRINLNGTNGTTTLDLLATTIRMFDGTNDLPLFNLTDGILYLQNVVAEQIKANIQITTPKIIGGVLTMEGDSKIVSDAAAGIVRINGGTTDGQASGGQLDVMGNSHPTTPGAVLITPGDHADARVEIRDRTGATRIHVRDDGMIVLTDVIADDILADSYDTPSARRLKTRIRAMKDGMTLVRKLRGVRFDWKYRPTKNDIGFIAEDVARVVPAVVRRSARGRVEGLDYGRLTPVLVEAAKDLDRRLARIERVLALGV